MPKSRVRSAKGRMIDFDLLKIKRQIGGKPITIDVKARQAFIDQKARRRVRKQTNQTAAAAAIKVDNETLIESEPTETKPLVDAQTQKPAIPVVELTPTETEHKHKHAKQKVRPPTSE